MTITDVELINSPYWNCFLYGCEEVRIHGVRIVNPMATPNGDGLDLSLDGLAEIPELYRGDWRNPNRVRWYVSSDDWNFDKPALDAFIYEVRGSMFDKSNWKGLHP